MSPQQPPRPLHRVRDMEQAADQRLHPGKRPPLVGLSVRLRAALQLSFQSGYLPVRQSRSARRSLRRHPGQALLAPLATPAFHRPFRETQRGSDLPVLLASLEASNGLEPETLPPGPLGVGQAAALRISHPARTTDATGTVSGEQPDITQSSSLADGQLVAPTRDRASAPESADPALHAVHEHHRSTRRRPRIRQRPLRIRTPTTDAQERRHSRFVARCCWARGSRGVTSATSPTADNNDWRP